MNEKDKEDARKVYAMVSNIDDNAGKVLRKLEELRLADNTVVIFMTDNGPQQRRYLDGMRGLKGTVYRGGVRVPLLIRYPGAGKGIKEIEATVAHIDIMPTIASICNASLPAGVKIDGINLKPLIDGSRSEINELSDRSLFFYWTRHSPELYNNIALQKGRYRLVGNTGYNATPGMFELFDIITDPYERKNIVNDQTQVAAEMKAELDRKFMELVTSVNMTEKQYINVGTSNENPVILNRNDADGQWGVWEQEEAYGTWRVHFEQGIYNFKFRFLKPLPAEGRMMLEIKSFIVQAKFVAGITDVFEMKNVYVPDIKCDFTPFYLSGQKKILPLWVEIEKNQ
jgi:arylsulfatase